MVSRIAHNNKQEMMQKVALQYQTELNDCILKLGDLLRDNQTIDSILSVLILGKIQDLNSKIAHYQKLAS